MATYRDTVKQWYLTGAKPTQAQFWTLFDDLRFGDEGISVADVVGLSDMLTSKASQDALDAFTGGELLQLNANGSYDLAAGYLLEKLIIIPSVDMNISIGKTVGGEEISMAEAISGNTGESFELNLFDMTNVKTIYFGGITAATSIIIFKRKVKLV